jgi:hypothetical protein
LWFFRWFFRACTWLRGEYTQRAGKQLYPGCTLSKYDAFRGDIKLWRCFYLRALVALNGPVRTAFLSVLAK